MAPSAAPEAASKLFFLNCEQDDLQTQVAKKQHAVEIAMETAQKIFFKMQVGIAKVTDRERAAFDLIGGEDLKVWMADYVRVKEKINDFSIFAGVSGATGVGKTSLLNALLDLPNLLPSSGMEAATATACQIAFNHDDTEGSEFQAAIKFRSLDDVRAEIRGTLEALSESKRQTDDDFIDEEERQQVEGEREKRIIQGFEKLTAVWSISRDDVASEQFDTADKILASRPDIMDLLGTTKTVLSSEAGLFSENIKPYLDSSKAEIRYQTGAEFPMWPLIEEVDLKVKSDLLKNGLVLVDLPGLSDATGSREAVANNYYSKLAVTTIVSPAVRAADEKTGAELLSRWQRIPRQLDERSYSVVLSKIDDVTESDIIKSAEAREHTYLARWEQRLRALRADLRKLELEAKANLKEKKKLKSAISETRRRSRESSASTPPLKHELKANRVKCKQLARTIKRLQAEQQGLVRKLKHKCVVIRNRAVEARIQENFIRRQQISANSHLYDSSVEVFPVCSKAYTKLRQNEDAMDGFPTEIYTGIPRLKQWLNDVTLKRREQHLDSILSTLRRLCHNVDKWRQDFGKGLVHFSFSKVEGILMDAKVEHCKVFDDDLSRSFQQIKKLEPIKDVDKKVDECRERAGDVITRWRQRDPDSPNDFPRIASSTLTAILRRNGQPYQSRDREYDFVQTLAAVTLEVVAEDWAQVFDAGLDTVKQRIMTRIKTSWELYLREVHRKLETEDPRLLPYIKEVERGVLHVWNEAIDQLYTTLAELTSRAKAVNGEANTAIRAELAPIFEKALEISGKGSLKARLELLKDDFVKRDKRVFSRAFRAMKSTYDTVADQAEAPLREIANFIGRQVTNDFLALVRKLHHINGAKQETALEKKKAIQLDVDGYVTEWQRRWSAPPSSPVSRARENQEIPWEYIEDDGSDDNGETGGSSSGGSSDMEESKMDLD